MWADYAWFADWRNGRDDVQYATNVAACNYYSASHAKDLRQNTYVEFMQRVQRGDTIIIGVDYYAELGVSNFFFPEKFHALYGQWLIDGEVLFFQVMRQEDRVVFKQLPNKKGRY